MSKADFHFSKTILNIIKCVATLTDSAVAGSSLFEATSNNKVEFVYRRTHNNSHLDVDEYTNINTDNKKKNTGTVGELLSITTLTQMLPHCTLEIIIQSRTALKNILPSLWKVPFYHCLFNLCF